MIGRVFDERDPDVDVGWFLIPSVSMEHKCKKLDCLQHGVKTGKRQSVIVLFN